MTRICRKCNEKLVVNERLGLMECISGKHVEPINTVRPQWWNNCPKCGQIGLNDASQERFTQAFKEDGTPIFNKGSITFNQKNPESITCKACGNVFSK